MPRVSGSPHHRGECASTLAIFPIVVRLAGMLAVGLALLLLRHGARGHVRGLVVRRRRRQARPRRRLALGHGLRLLRRARRTTARAATGSTSGLDGALPHAANAGDRDAGTSSVPAPLKIAGYPPLAGGARRGRHPPTRRPRLLDGHGQSNRTRAPTSIEPRRTAPARGGAGRRSTSTRLRGGEPRHRVQPRRRRATCSSTPAAAGQRLNCTADGRARPGRRLPADVPRRGRAAGRCRSGVHEPRRPAR